MPFKLPSKIADRAVGVALDLIVREITRKLQGFPSGMEVRAFIVNGTNGTLLADINGGISVARTGAGRYTVTWTRPWLSTYVVVGSCFAGASGVGIWSIDGSISYSPTGFGCMTINSNVFADLNWFCIAIGPRLTASEAL